MDNLRRFPPPWTVEEEKDAFRVYDANHMQVAVVVHRDALHTRGYQYAHQSLTRDEARRIAAGISKLPELMKRLTY